MNPELSLILPSIRPDNLVGVYESIKNATKRSFELIVVGPYALPQELEQHKNIKYVRDFGNPVRAHNIGLLMCEAPIITWIADDALIIEDALDKHLDMLDAMGPEENNVVVAGYYEGQVGSSERETLQPNEYFMVRNTPAGSPYLPSNWWLFNVAYMHKKFVYALGGWDANYEGTWTAHTDLAIRAQAAGANVQMCQYPHSVCDHMPGSSGDHKPIFECQTYHDEPLIQSKYRRPDWRKANSLTVSIMNWKDAPAIWKRRFNDD